MHTLKLIKTITIPNLKGTKIIANSKLFDWIDQDFKNWGANKKGKATEEMKVDVMEMKEKATFQQMMSPDSLLTQEQILYFIENHKDLISKNRYTFFPFKSGEKVFVADVYVHSVGSLAANVHRFSNDYVWPAESRYRFVVPQLNSKLPSSNDSLTLSSSDTLENAIKICKDAGLTVTKTY